MHPRIQMDHKDLCPLCGMELTPVKSHGGGGRGGPAAPLSLSPDAWRWPAWQRPRSAQELSKDIRTVGRVELDETRVAHIASRVEGRVDQVSPTSPEPPSSEANTWSASTAPSW